MADTPRARALADSNCLFIAPAEDILDPDPVILALVGRLKAFDVALIALDETDDVVPPVIEHRQVRYQGFWPAVDYLCRVRPNPEILSGEPQRRGVVNTITEKLRRAPERTLRDLLFRLYSERTVGLHNIDILDLAVAAFAHTPAQHRHPWLKRVNAQVEAVIHDELHGCGHVVLAAGAIA